MSLAVIVLAAGEGTRMKSSRPKVLHAICGKPMIDFVLKSTAALNPDRTIVVVGHKADEVMRAVGGVEFANQAEQLGTGHAVLTAADLLADFDGTVLVVSGDTPLVRASTLSDLVGIHNSSKAAASILTAVLKNPTGYGRIIRSLDGAVSAIVEEKDATAAQKKIVETNSGIYCFDKKKLFDALSQVKADNKQKEYYLTDVIEILNNRGEKVMASTANNSDEIMGVNSHVQLAEADKAMRRVINEEFMLSGVTLIDPDMTFISPDAKIGRDTVIYPMTFIEGKTSIGEGCAIGPSCRLIDSSIGNDVTVENSIVRESTVEDGADLGPFCHIRPGTLVKSGAKVGGFVEIKNSEVGTGSKVPHLSYIGDAQIGDYVNIGAGTITCNYDGANKYKTVIEDGAFIGSDTMLVAPVKIGEGAFTGAGSVISKDVPADGLAIERAEQKVIDNWAKKRRKKKDILED